MYNQLLEFVWNELNYWHTLQMPEKGIAYWGITLIPPSSMESVISIIEDIEECSELKELLLDAERRNKYVIHFGI